MKRRKVLASRAYVIPSSLGALAAANLTTEHKFAPTVTLCAFFYADVAQPTSGAEIFAGIGSRGVWVTLSSGRPQRPHHHVPDTVVRRVHHVDQLVISTSGRTNKRASLPDNVVPPHFAGAIGEVVILNAVSQLTEFWEFVLTCENCTRS